MEGRREILPVTVKNVKEMRRFIPQFMLDVKAMARPLMPPGKISLRTSQATEIEGTKHQTNKQTNKQKKYKNMLSSKEWISLLYI